MQTFEVRRVGTLAAAIGLIVAALVYLDAQGSVAHSGRAPAGSAVAQERSTRAGEAEAAIARTNLSGRMQAALGDAFGGTWFEPATAKLHVGVVSPASRRLAEAVAAHAGLSELVAETAVGSTWPQLEATQEDWNRRLADLFERGLVRTSLAADRNSVTVELASAVPRPRRTALEREAAASGNVEVVAVPSPDLYAAHANQCKKWVQFAAYCDPTIVAGVTLASEKDGSGKRKTTCSTGPAVRLKDRSTGESATKTYILTAGHCIHKGGGEKAKWYAFDKTNEKETEIGPAGVYLNGEIDIGVIEVKPPNWAKANDPVPVVPTTAFWDKTLETKPNVVSFEAKPKTTTKTCVIGQRSMEVCGTIKAENVSVTFKGEPVATKTLFEVELEKHKDGTQTRAGRGDSGGPMRAAGSVSTVEGVFVGFDDEGETEEGKVIYFHSVETAFAELKAKKGIELELLKSSNQKRAHPGVTADDYPVTFEANSPSAEDQFTAFGSSVQCAESEFHGELTEEQQEAEPAVIELTPTYEGCIASGLSTTFTDNGCKYKLVLEEEVAEGTYSASADIVCPEEEAGFQFDVSGVCTVTFPPQSGLEVPTLTNSGGDIVVESGTIEGIKVQREGLCGSSETNAGVYHLNEAVTISGTSGGEVEIDIGSE